jgi:hypothetical protein
MKSSTGEPPDRANFNAAHANAAHAGLCGRDSNHPGCRCSGEIKPRFMPAENRRE